MENRLILTKRKQHWEVAEELASGQERLCFTKVIIDNISGGRFASRAKNEKKRWETIDITVARSGHKKVVDVGSWYLKLSCTCNNAIHARDILFAAMKYTALQPDSFH